MNLKNGLKELMKMIVQFGGNLNISNLDFKQ
jgi:hypothetical protein